MINAQPIMCNTLILEGKAPREITMTEDQLAKASINYYVDSASGVVPVDLVALEDGERVAKASLVTLQNYITREFK